MVYPLTEGNDSDPETHSGSDPNVAAGAVTGAELSGVIDFEGSCVPVAVAGVGGVVVVVWVPVGCVITCC